MKTGQLSGSDSESSLSNYEVKIKYASGQTANKKYDAYNYLQALNMCAEELKDVIKQDSTRIESIYIEIE